jgi:hypothetical protein
MKHLLLNRARSLVAPLPALLPALLLTHAAQAHEGHGLPGTSHWHVTDLLGFMGSVAAVGGLLWWRNRK